MKRQKSIGLRILYGIGAVGVGMLVHIVGVIVDKLIFIQISPEHNVGLLGVLFVILGFVVMGYLIYRWAIIGKFP